MLMPAQCTSASMRPSRRTTSSTARATEASSVTSMATYVHRAASPGVRLAP